MALLIAQGAHKGKRTEDTLYLFFVSQHPDTTDEEVSWDQSKKE